MTESEFYFGKADFCHLLLICVVVDLFNYITLSLKSEKT